MLYACCICVVSPFLIALSIKANFTFILKKTELIQDSSNKIQLLKLKHFVTKSQLLFTQKKQVATMDKEVNEICVKKNKAYSISKINEKPTYATPQISVSVIGLEKIIASSSYARISMDEGVQEQWDYTDDSQNGTIEWPL